MCISLSPSSSFAVRQLCFWTSEKQRKQFMKKKTKTTTTICIQSGTFTAYDGVPVSVSVSVWVSTVVIAHVRTHAEKVKNVFFSRRRDRWCVHTRIGYIILIERSSDIISTHMLSGVYICYVCVCVIELWRRRSMAAAAAASQRHFVRWREREKEVASIERSGSKPPVIVV